MTKLPYNPRVECARHKGQIAAVCPECYDDALAQQRRQRQAEQKREHDAYLTRKGQR